MLRNNGDSEIKVQLMGQLFDFPGLRRDGLQGKVFPVFLQGLPGIASLQGNGEIQERGRVMRIALQSEFEAGNGGVCLVNAWKTALQFDEPQSIASFRGAVELFGIFVILPGVLQLLLPGSFGTSAFHGQLQSRPAHEQESIDIFGMRGGVGGQVINGPGKVRLLQTQASQIEVRSPKIAVQFQCFQIGAGSGIRLARAMISEAEEIPGSGLNSRRRAVKELHGFIENGNCRGELPAVDQLFAFAQVPRAGRPAGGQTRDRDDGENLQGASSLFYRQHLQGW
jgi:hypothetical protein